MAGRVVVDSSIVIKWFVAEPYSDQARRVLEGYQAAELALLAPDLLYAEVGNIIWKKHRFQGLAREDAQEIINSIQLIDFTLTSSADLLTEAYRLAVHHQRTVYDALYLALSVRQRCPLLTADEKLVNALSTTFPNVMQVVHWP